ncbi:tripartite tricarboxylate transporter substrate binding protein [soil metagenome]
MKRRILAAAVAAAAALTALPFGAAQAQFPERPINLIVPFAAGGNIDTTARGVANLMSQTLGQTVVVQNKGGAGGLLGAEYVARSAPDGYTLLLVSTGSLAAAPALYPKLTFSPVKDFATAGGITRVPLILVVNPKLPVKNVAELIALAKAKPGSLTMASTGTGTSNHLAGELFQSMAGVKFVHVPYRGSAQALNDLLGGQVDLMFDNLTSSLPFIKDDKLRALGVTGAKRSAALPALATLSESGLPGFEASTTTGIAFPAGTPSEITKKIDAALEKAVKDQKLRASFAQLGADMADLDAAGFATLMKSEGVKWGKVITDADVKPD